MDKTFSIEISVRDGGGTYTARYKGVQASNTSGAEQAAQQLSKKIFGKLQRATIQRVNQGETTQHKVFSITPDITQQCRICGCSWGNACSDGCYWVEENLCNKCVGDDDE